MYLFRKNEVLTGALSWKNTNWTQFLKVGYTYHKLLLKLLSGKSYWAFMYVVTSRLTWWSRSKVRVLVGPQAPWDLQLWWSSALYFLYIVVQSKTHTLLPLRPTIPHFFRLKNCSWPLKQTEHHKIFYIYSLFLWEINFIRLFSFVDGHALKDWTLHFLPSLPLRDACRKKDSICLTAVYLFLSFWVFLF